MDDVTAAQVVAQFAGAYFSKDRVRLAGAITKDAEWHFAFGNDGPHGRVRVGLDGFLQGIAENEALFERLRFDEVLVRAFGDSQIVMTYLANGRYREGEAFALRGIELITVRNGRVAVKDVFWKQRVG
jgi:ketosteroid isomerase-like protein